jgi:hypothetical protein
MMKQTDNRWRYFDKPWFVKHQRKLLFFLNIFPFLFLTRYLFGIRRREVGWFKRIVSINPNSYNYHCYNNRYKLIVRASPKYSKRLYCTFKYYWLFLHWIDTFFLRTPKVQFSFGFDTLTISPQTGGGILNTSCDGHAGRTIYHPFESFSDLRTGSGNGSTDDWNGILIELKASSRTHDDLWSIMSRGMLSFDISSLPEEASMISNTLYLYASSTAQINEFSSDPDIYVVDTLCPKSAGEIKDSDYDLSTTGTVNYSDTRLDSITWAMLVTGDTYHEFDITASTGPVDDVLRYGIRLSWDILDSPPKWFEEAFCVVEFASSEITGVEPYLEYYYDTFVPIICLI